MALPWLDWVGLAFACACACAFAFALPRRLSLLPALLVSAGLPVLLAEVALSPAFWAPLALCAPALSLLACALAVLPATLLRSLVLVLLFLPALLPLPPALPLLPSALLLP